MKVMKPGIVCQLPPPPQDEERRPENVCSERNITEPGFPHDSSGGRGVKKTRRPSNERMFQDHWQEQSVGSWML